MTTGIALIGYGAMGRAHAMGWRDIGLHYGLPADDTRIIGVATTRQSTADAAARELGCSIATTDALALIARDDVQIVDICTPHDSHEALVLAAAGAGKHIYCEKPLARDLAQARHMAAAVRAAGVQLQLTHNFRFLPAVLRMKALIDDGFLGRIFSFHGRYFRASYIDASRPMSWRLKQASAGGGALMDMGVHLIDWVLWMLGPAAQVNANMTTFIDRRPVRKGASEFDTVDVDDMALLHLRMQSGAVGAVEVSRMGTGATNELSLDIRGDKGALRFNLEDPNYLFALDMRDAEAVRGIRRIETVQKYPGQLAPDGTAAVGVARSHAECQYQFLRAVRGERVASPDANDGLRVHALVDAAYRSATTGAWTQVDV
jgi:predicted dehydrogenase